MSGDEESRKDESVAGSERNNSQACGDFHADSDASGDTSPVPPTWIGWGLRIVSVLLIATLLFYLVVQATAPETDFRLEVEPEWAEASDRDGELLVPVRLVNDSTRTVRNLKVELMDETPDPIEVEIGLFGPGEQVTYVIPLTERGEVSHKVLSYER